jgi:hypothetical protein
MCISAMTRFMISAGQGEPAMIPVRRLVKLKDSKSGSASSAMNIVGTPYRLVQRSAATASSTARGSKEGPGMTMHAPCVQQPRLPTTMPKQ